MNGWVSSEGDLTERNAHPDRVRHPRQLGQHSRRSRSRTTFASASGDLVDYGPDPLALRAVGDDGTPATMWSAATTTTASRRGLPSPGETGYRYLTRVSRGLVWGVARSPAERRFLIEMPLTSRFNGRGAAVPPGPRDAARPTRRVPDERPSPPGRVAWKGMEADVVCVGALAICSSTSGRATGHVVINPGSVGNPRDGDPRAAYAIVDRQRSDRAEARRLPGRGDRSLGWNRLAELP